MKIKIAYKHKVCTFKVLPSPSSALSKEEKKDLIRKMRGSMKGTWGNSVEEIDVYLKSERKAWNR